MTGEVTMSASRKLSALGHPGYGEAHARQVLAAMDRYGMTAHEAIYGGREAQIKVFEHRESGS